MSAPEEMVGDLEEFSQRFLSQADDGVLAAAQEAARRAGEVHSPLYGVAVRSRAARTGEFTASVQVDVSAVRSAPGSVLGGTAAASRAAASRVEEAAGNAGFERR